MRATMGKIVHVFDPGVGLYGVLVADNVAAGPSIGGCHIAEDLTVEECFRLARAMTMKNAAALKPAPAVRPISAPFRPA